MKNFTVILISFSRHHVRIDDHALYRVLKNAGCKDAILYRRGSAPGSLSMADYRKLWRKYFNIDRIERLTENEDCAIVRFDHAIITDGVAVSFQMLRTKYTCEQNDDEVCMAAIRTKFLDADQVYGLDPGLRLVLGGVRRNRDGTEDNIRLTNIEYHHKTGYYQ